MTICMIATVGRIDIRVRIARIANVVTTGIRYFKHPMM